MLSALWLLVIWTKGKTTQEGFLSWPRRKQKLSVTWMNLVTNPFTGFEEAATWFVSRIISVIGSRSTDQDKRKTTTNNNNNTISVQEKGTVQVAVLVHTSLLVRPHKSCRIELRSCAYLSNTSETVILGRAKHWAYDLNHSLSPMVAIRLGGIIHL